MENLVTFPEFITKNMEIQKSDSREFTGHMTAEIVDKQDEFVYVEEIMKVMETFMKHSPHITDSHSNRICGEVLGYEKSEIDGHPSILIKGRIKKADGVTLYDQVWDNIKNGVYKGLSMGGGTKRKEKMFMKNGKMIQLLKDLEIYEIAVCVSPANPLAMIKEVNTFAKSNELDPTIIKSTDYEKNCIQCADTLVCGFEKELDVCDSGHRTTDEAKKEIGCEMEKEYQPMQKPIRGHSWEYWDDKLKDEYPDKETRSKVIGAMEYKDKNDTNINVDGEIGRAHV